MNQTNNKEPYRNDVRFFGAAFDPDECEGAIQRQRYLAALKSGIDKGRFLDPYDAVIRYLDELLGSKKFTKLGKVFVESWLTPKPDLEDEVLVDAGNYSVFIDTNGCRDYASTLIREALQKGS